jgi:outer membrane protein TolC
MTAASAVSTLARGLGALGWVLLATIPPLSAQTEGPRPLSLEEALHLAVPASENLGIARAEVDRAIGNENSARSGLFPQLSGKASYVRTIKSQFSTEGGSSTGGQTCSPFNPDPLAPLGTRVDSLESAVRCISNADPFAALSSLPFGRKNQYTFALNASQTLFDGRIFAQTRAARAGRRSAEIGLTSAEAQLTLDVTQAYYDAVLTDRLLAIAQATLDQADTTLAQTRVARQVGTQPEFELLRAQVTRDNLRPAVIQRRTDRELAYLRLKQLLNLPLERGITLSTELTDTTLAEIPTLAQTLASPTDTATDARAPVRQASEAVRAQEGLYSAAKAERLPALALSSQYAKIAYPTSGLPSSSDYLTDWSVTLGLQIPIFTGGRIAGGRKVARANLEESRLRLRQTQELAQLDTRNALERLQAAESQWAASEGTAEQAERAYHIAEIRFREGISTQTELNDSRIQLQQAQANLAVAARDLQVARVRVALLGSLPISTTPTSVTPAASAPAAASSTASQAAQTGSGTP